MQEYLLGNKGMKWLPVALSILAADTSAVSYLGVPAWSFQENMRLNQNIFTYLLAIPIVIWLFLAHLFSRQLVHGLPIPGAAASTCMSGC